MLLVRALVLGALVFGGATRAEAQGVIVDHTSLPLFDQIPDQYLQAAASLRMMFVNRSVGANINDGLTCLASATSEQAPTSCRRYIHVVPAFSSPQSEVQWSRAGGYPRTNWDYFGWPGTGILPELSCGVSTGFWYQQLECFVRYVDANPTRYDVYSYMTSYLEVDSSSDIASATTGFFADQSNRFDVGDFEAMQARHQGRVFILHTSNLARGIGTAVSTTFNNQMRQYARDNNEYLLDVAAILSHDPAGNPCYDNRDGVPYSTGNASENHPNDGVNTPALCQQYTRESDGGHLGNPDVGKIRVAKAFWVLMARIAGWNPGGTSAPRPLPPANLRIVR